MYCKQCGSELEPNTSFCGMCGTHISEKNNGRSTGEGSTEGIEVKKDSLNTRTLDNNDVSNRFGTVTDEAVHFNVKNGLFSGVSAETLPNGGGDNITTRTKVNKYSSSYNTSRTIATVISFIGWVVVIISTIVFLLLTESSGSFDGFTIMRLLPAMSGVISGLFLVMAGQLTRAIVDTAENTGQMLTLMKNKDNNG